MDYREYRENVKSHAAAVFEDYEDHDFCLADRVHEVVDSSQLVIYTAKNLDVLRHSDNQDAYFEDFGQLESAESFGTVMAQLAYYAFQRDIYDQIARWQRSMSFCDLVDYFGFSGGPYAEIIEIETEDGRDVEILKYGLDDFDVEDSTPVHLFWELDQIGGRAYLASARSFESAYELAINSGKIGRVDAEDMEQDDIGAVERGELTRFWFTEDGEWINREYVQGAEIDTYTLNICLAIDE